MSFRETETLFPALIFSRAPYRRRISESSQYAALRSSFARRTDVGALRRSLAASSRWPFSRLCHANARRGELEGADKSRARTDANGRAGKIEKERKNRRRGETAKPTSQASFVLLLFLTVHRTFLSLSLVTSVYRRLFPIPRLHSSLLISICTRAPSLPQRAHGITVQESVSRVHFSRLTCSHEAMRGGGGRGAREEASSMPGSLLSHGLMPVSAVSVPPNNR